MDYEYLDSPPLSPLESTLASLDKDRLVLLECPGDIVLDTYLAQLYAAARKLNIRLRHRSKYDTATQVCISVHDKGESND